MRPIMIAAIRGASLRATPPLAPQLASGIRALSLRKVEGDASDSWFAKKEREALEKLKASLAKKKKPIDEADEKVRLQKIIEAVGVREAIRDELTVKLLLWKHDEDLTLE